MNNPSTPPTFPKHDPGSPAFWDVRFQANFTPWNRGRVPDNFRAHILQRPAARSFIPGCGNAHEVGYFLALGWQVTAIDFSSAAVAQAKHLLEQNNLPNYCIVEADFFDAKWSAKPFDLVYESAFLCALPLVLRRQWADQMAAVTKIGGELAGYFFVCADKKGPPFGISASELNNLLMANFDLVENREPTDSIPVFVGRERWMVWRRRGDRNGLPAQAG